MTNINKIYGFESAVHDGPPAPFHARGEDGARSYRDEEKEDTGEAFRSRLNALAEEAGGTSKLAKKVGVPDSSLRKWIDGPSEPNRSRLVKIARGSGVLIEWLATGKGPRAPGEETSIPIDAIPVASGLGRGLSRPSSDGLSSSSPDRGRTSRPSADQQPPTPPYRWRLLPDDFACLAVCLDAVQKLPGPLDAQRQLALAYAMVGFIYFLDEQGHQSSLLDQEDLAGLARMLNKVVTTP